MVGCAFYRDDFIDQTLFWAFREMPERDGYFRGPFRVLTPVAFHVYDRDRNGETCAAVARKIDPREFLHQRIRYPAQRRRTFCALPAAERGMTRPAERSGRRNARGFMDGPAGPAEES